MPSNITYQAKVFSNGVCEGQISSNSIEGLEEQLHKLELIDLEEVLEKDDDN